MKEEEEEREEGREVLYYSRDPKKLREGEATREALFLIYATAT